MRAAKLLSFRIAKAACAAAALLVALPGPRPLLAKARNAEAAQTGAGRIAKAVPNRVAAVPKRFAVAPAAKHSKAAAKRLPIPQHPPAPPAPNADAVAADAATAARVHAWERGARRPVAPSRGKKSSQPGLPGRPLPAPPAPDPKLLTADARLIAGHPAALRRQTPAVPPASPQDPPSPHTDAHPADATGVAQPAAGVAHPAEDSSAAPPPALGPELLARSAKSSQAADAAGSADAQAVAARVPALDPVLFNRRGGLIMPPPLRGTHDILVRQNTIADKEGLLRVKDDEDLLQLRRQRQLVALPAGEGIRVAEELPQNRRFCRPWTQTFLVDLGRAHYARFKAPLQVNSAVRTVAFQRSLRRVNGNAAPINGETASPHLTGQTVDIAKHGLSMTEVAWMRGYLLPLQQEGKIDVEEEFQQSVFHVSVYKSYAPAAAQPKAAPRPKSRSALLAAGLR